MPAPFPRGRRTEPTTEPGPLRSSAQANAEASRDPDVRHARQSYRRNLPPRPSSTRVWDGRRDGIFRERGPVARRSYRVIAGAVLTFLTRESRHRDARRPEGEQAGGEHQAGGHGVGVPGRPMWDRDRLGAAVLGEIRAAMASRFPSARPGLGSARSSSASRAAVARMSSTNCRAAGSSASRDAMAACSLVILNLAQRVGRQARIVEIVRHDGPPFRIGPGRPGSR